MEVCDDGFWLITPRGGGFPFYGTLNCANHPADIGNLASWSVVECDGCGSKPVEGTVTVSCDGVDFTPPPSTSGGDVVFAATPSPADAVGDALGGSSGASRAFGAGGGGGSLWQRQGLATSLVVAALVAAVASVGAC